MIKIDKESVFLIFGISISHKIPNILLINSTIIILINAIKHKLQYALCIHQTKHSNGLDKLLKEYYSLLLFLYQGEKTF
jgi:hypothetical protein